MFVFEQTRSLEMRVYDGHVSFFCNKRNLENQKYLIKTENSHKLKVFILLIVYLQTLPWYKSQRTFFCFIWFGLSKEMHTSMNNKIQEITDTFSSISLKEIGAVALMKRTDTKFVLPVHQLGELLEKVKDVYCILEIDGNRLMTYSSMYFDTPAKKFYLDHHNRKVNRTKIRMRKYVESDICFLEIKQKNGKGETNKSRISIDDFEEILSPKSADFVFKVTKEDWILKPTLVNDFTRITLANIADQERVTIDFNLSFSKGERVKGYEKIVIVEVKQERLDRKSTIIKALRNMNYHPYGMSKYCIGMLGLYKALKYNRFKQKLTKLNKLSA
jgi:hypothetical protein